MIKKEIWVDVNSEGGLERAILKTLLFGIKISEKNITDQFYFDGDGVLISTKHIAKNVKIYTSYDFRYR